MRYAAPLAVCLLSCAFVRAQPTTQPSAAPPVVGDRAPDFALGTLDGETVRLTELTKAGPVVLVQLRGWVGYQCPLCTKQVGDLVGHADEFRKARAQVVLVYPGPAASIEKHAGEFKAGQNLPDGFSFVTDPDLKFVNDWKLRWNKPGETAYPATFVIDPGGVVRFAKVSHSHGNRASSKQVLDMLNTESPSKS